MKSMEHIHIISAGESIHKTFPKAVNEFKIDCVIIVVEENVFKNPDFGRNSLIINAINEVQNLAFILEKSFEIKNIPSITLEAIRDAILEIFTTYNKSKFYFNITGGTKILSNGLFMMSIWINGKTYYIDENGSIQILTTPKIKIENVGKNINYVILLNILASHKNSGILQKHLFIKMKEEYKPIRENTRKMKRNLSRGTLSKWINDLYKWGLLSTNYAKDNKKEKVISITNDGLFALNFIRASNNQN
jgi:hypothetical protein